MYDDLKQANALGWRLLSREAGDENDPEQFLSAADQTFARLYRQLADLIGAVGFVSLAERARYLAAKDYPELAAVSFQVQSDGLHVVGLQINAQDRDFTKVRGGVAAMLGAFFWLIATLIGDVLFLQIVRDVWPEVPPADWEPLPEEKQD